MNTLSTIDGCVIDEESSKPKSRILSRALSAGHSRVPPSYKESERSLSPPLPKKLSSIAHKSDEKDNARNNTVQKDNAWTDTREEIEPSIKPTSRYENFSDDASRDEPSVNSGSSPVRTEKKHVEQSDSKTQSTTRQNFDMESTTRPRYRDLFKLQAEEHREESMDPPDNSELKLSSPKAAYAVQTEIESNLSGLSTTSPRTQGAPAINYRVDAAPLPPPVTPENTRFLTPTSFVKSYSAGQAASWQDQVRKDQARQRLQERMKSIDSRVKGRRSAMQSAKPWESETPTYPNHTILGDGCDKYEGKLIVPPLTDEDDVWRNSVSSPTGAALSSLTAGCVNNTSGFDNGIVKSLQARVEYYKTCLKGNEKKLDELLENERQLHELLKNQEMKYEQQTKHDTELHDQELKEVNAAMEEAKNAIEALESTLEKLKEASSEKDDCISGLKEKLCLMELELKERVTTTAERVSTYEEQIIGLKGNVTELKGIVSEKEEELTSRAKQIKELEEKMTTLTTQCAQTKNAYEDSCNTLQEKEQLLAKSMKELEEEKKEVIIKFQQYRSDLQYKMDAATVRTEAITKEKDKLIGSLHKKVELLESSVAEKEDEAKRQATWRLEQEKLRKDWKAKEKELNDKIQTLAMSLAEKDKVLGDTQRLLAHERKLKAASDERIGAMKNELGKCQQELIDERRKQNQEARRRNLRSSNRRDSRQEDPPPTSLHSRRRPIRCDQSPRNYPSGRRHRERYDVEETSSSSSEASSDDDSIFKSSSEEE